MKTSKFCAQATIGTRNVESIRPARENATTGTPEAIPGEPAAAKWGEFETWATFALIVAVFLFVLAEDCFSGASDR